ncbi:MAG TPA: hypothetical protein VMH40_00425 [Myxococcaceae bacterium]|nr:hypothetical protein [Myxococcaceae bacterium]
MAIPATAALPVQRPCVQADEALKYALVGIICVGFILEPMAISKALKARREIRADPTLTGGSKATAALVIASVALFLWVVGMVARFSKPAGSR